MKKFIILIISIFLLTGCYDNIELNNLAIITGIGIDYHDDNYYLTYEILNDIKTADNTTMLSYTLSGSGKTISDAFINTNYKVGKKPYFAHLKVVLLSENVINGHFKDLTDYLLRDTEIRDEFIAIVTLNTTPKDILTHNNDNTPVISDYLIHLIDNEKYNNNLANNENYQKILAKLVGNHYDITLSTVTINKNDEITLNNLVIFKDYNYQDTLSKKESGLYNLLSKSIFAMEFTKEYEDGIVTISLNYSKADIKVKNDEIIIDLELEGKVIDNEAGIKLNEEKSYKMLNQDFANIIKEDVVNFVSKLQKNQSDILGLQDIYYKTTRKENKNLWETAKINVNVDLKINTKGFIFEVTNEK